MPFTSEEIQDDFAEESRFSIDAEQYLYQRFLDQQSYLKEYYSRPEVKAHARSKWKRWLSDPANAERRKHWSREYYTSPCVVARNRERMRLRRANAKVSGLCTTCHKRRPEKGYICQFCTDRSRGYASRRRPNKGFAAMRKARADAMLDDRLKGMTYKKLKEKYHMSERTISNRIKEYNEHTALLQNRRLGDTGTNSGSVT